jgi:hypothetical protein
MTGERYIRKAGLLLSIRLALPDIDDTHGRLQCNWPEPDSLNDDTPHGQLPPRANYESEEPWRKYVI